MYILNEVFEWDPAKAAMNRAKHGVSFAEAATVFADLDALDGPDLAHSAGENRRLRVGFTVRRTDDGESIRIINARRASRKERTAYARVREH